MLAKSFLIALSCICLVYADSDKSKIGRLSIIKRYEAYLKGYGKDLGRVANSKRINQFAYSLNEIKQHNQNSAASYKKGLNQFSDMLIAEKNQVFPKILGHTKVTGHSDTTEDFEKHPVDFSQFSFDDDGMDDFFSGQVDDYYGGLTDDKDIDNDDGGSTTADDAGTFNRYYC